MRKKFLWKLVGLSKMLPVTFQRNMAQINRCKKKLFFLANHYFRLQITGVGPVHAEKNWIFSIFEPVKKVFNQNSGVGRGRLYLVFSIVWATELISVRICFSTKQKMTLICIINVQIGFRLKSWLSSHLLPQRIDHCHGKSTLDD